MTPERIEEIKRYVYGADEKRYVPGIRYYEDVIDLLATLEESQQHIEIADRNAREAITRHMEKELAALQLSNTLSGQLVEAQQTIARQREALEFLADDSNWSWWNVGTEDETVTWVGGTDPQHAARESLGNREGVKTDESHNNS